MGNPLVGKGLMANLVMSICPTRRSCFCCDIILFLTCHHFFVDLGQQRILWLFLGSSENENWHQQQNCVAVTSTDGKKTKREWKNARSAYFGDCMLQWSLSCIVECAFLWSLFSLNSLRACWLRQAMLEYRRIDKAGGNIPISRLYKRHHNDKWS